MRRASLTLGLVNRVGTRDERAVVRVCQRSVYSHPVPGMCFCVCIFVRVFVRGIVRV